MKTATRMSGRWCREKRASLVPKPPLHANDNNNNEDIVIMIIIIIIIVVVVVVIQL